MWVPVFLSAIKTQIFEIMLQSPRAASRGSECQTGIFLTALPPFVSLSVVITPQLARLLRTVPPSP